MPARVWRFSLFTILIARFLLIGNEGSAQGFVWVSQIGASKTGIQNEPTRVRVAVDPSGNVFAVGSFLGTINFGTNSLTSQGSTDVFLAKYDPKGNLLWAKQAGGIGQDLGQDIATDAIGNVYIVGDFQGVATFDSTQLTSPSNINLFVAKYDSDGHLVWAQRGYGDGDSQGNGIAVMNSGEVFCAGNAGTAILIEKRDASGNVLWHTEHPEAGGQADAVQVDGKGDAYLSGQFSGTLNFGTNVLFTDYFQAVFVAKLDPAGNPLWAKQAGSAPIDNGWSLAVDGAGNAFVTGAFTQTIQFPGTNLNTLQNGGADGYVAKYDANGNFLWVNQISNYGNNSGLSVAADSNGNACVSGYISGSPFVKKYTADGNLLWSVLPNPNGYSQSYGIAIGPSNNVSVATWATGNIVFDGQTFTNIQGGDFFIGNISEEVPPVFITNPSSSRPGFVGGNPYTFTSSVRSVTPATFQWSFNGTNLLGATDASLTITNAQIANNGDYQVVASNEFGSVTSLVATLTVYYTVTVLVDGSGSVSINPSGKASYLGNSIIALNASTNSNSPLSSWSGNASGNANPLSVPVNTNLLIIATFADAITNIVIDDLDPRATFAGPWTRDTLFSMFESDYRYSGSSTSVTATAVFRPNIVVPGYYDVFAWFPASPENSRQAPFSVSSRDGNVTTNVNETIRGGVWYLLTAGRFFETGTNGFVSLSNSTGEPPSVQVAADAVRFASSTAPLFVANPPTENAPAGSTIVLRVSVSGSPPLAFQWQLNGNPIAGATNSVLLLSQVEPLNEGMYSVIASNFLGSITSAGGVFTVSPPAPPTLTVTGMDPERGPQLTLNSGPGVAFSIQSSSNLLDWALFTNVLNSTGTLQFADPSHTNGGTLFYRGLWPPQ